jgi:hypothetical protein
MGSLLSQAAERQVEIAVEAGDAIDVVELIYNNRVLQRWSIADDGSVDSGWQGRCKVYLELGWGEKNKNVDWDVELKVLDGALRGIEPRFRGHDIVAPQAGEEVNYSFSEWERKSENEVAFKTRTWGNPTITTANTQGMSLEIEGDAQTQLYAQLNGQEIVVPLGEFLQGAHSGYLTGFHSPAYRFSRAATRAEYVWEGSFFHHAQDIGRHWYYVRVRQKNGQMAWGSPIWVGD